MEEAAASNLFFGDCGSGEFDEGGVEIDVGGDVRDVAAGFEGSFPTDEKGNADSAFVGAAFEAFLAGVEHHHGFAVFVFAEGLAGAAGASAGHTIVGHKDEDSVFLKVPFGELGHEPPYVFVDVFDHTIEAGGLGGETEVGEAFGIGRRRDEGAVGCVGGDVGEKGFFFFLGLFHPTHGGGKKEVGAVAFGFHEGAVVANGGIEVFVAGDVGAGAFVTLPDASSTVDKDFIEPALMGLVGFLIAEVPLAKNSGSIASRFQNLGKYRGIKRHALAFENGVCDAILERMASRHESGAGG